MITKRIILVLLVALMSVTGVWAQNSGINWEYNETTRTLTIRSTDPNSAPVEMDDYDPDITTKYQPWKALISSVQAVRFINVLNIGANALNGASQLRSVDISDAMTTIGEKAFFNCSNLTSITLPNSIVTIRSSAFAGCSGLISITVEAKTPPELEALCFEGATTTIPVFVPNSTAVNAYKDAAGWGYFTNIVDGSILPKYKTELREFFMLLNACETISSSMQSKLNEGMAELDLCTSDANATQKLNDTKSSLISIYASEKTPLLEAAKKNESNDYVNAVYNEFLGKVNSANEAHDAGALKQAITAGVAAITSARILYNLLEQGITPVTPQGAGMRMKVTRKNGKVYEFKTQDVHSVEYYHKDE